MRAKDNLASAAIRLQPARLIYDRDDDGAGSSLTQVAGAISRSLLQVCDPLLQGSTPRFRRFNFAFASLLRQRY
jgi:hypothetical protein